MSISAKPYKCKECGYKKTAETNHYGEIYSWGSYNVCPQCPPYKRPNTWVFDGEKPEGAWTPEPWKKVKLGDIADIREIGPEGYNRRTGFRSRSDNPLRCSVCNSPGVYKAGMCDECYGRKDNPRTLSHRDIYEFNLYLRNCTNDQVQGVYEKERAAGRTAYATLAKMEADRRKLKGAYYEEYDNPGDVEKPWKGEFPLDRPSDMDAVARNILRSNLESGRDFSVGKRVRQEMGIRQSGTVIPPFHGPFTDGQYRQPEKREHPVYVLWDDGTKGWIHREALQIIRKDNPSIKHDSDTKQYYHVRVRSPKKGEQFRTIELKPGIKAVIGISRRDNPSKKGKRSDIQKILFDKDKFTIAQIKAWLKEHGFGKLK